ncbi:ABC transporter permease subunit [Conexibacter arvalis]|uniref:Peptide/nickel transport system permease protein n=1 Tax=Conexibacter arvalis TaxID=912552 RepID=A0A840IJ60_9ACTN|nr:peptide/nickel transport system permease protein [Conexibacter arvalis]
MSGGHPWLRFAARRLLLLAASLALLIVLTFLAMRLVPGDPVRAALGPSASAEVVEARRAALGLDDPALVQLRDYAGRVVRGDFGESLTQRRAVGDILGERLPATARLCLLAFLVVALVALPLGVAIAVFTRGGTRPPLAGAFTLGTGVVMSIPEYLCAAGLVALFGVTLGWLPIAGAEQASSYVLPVLALAAVPTAILARLTRVETLRVLDQEYIRVARSKRLPARALYLRHLLPNALTATLTVGGLLFGAMIASTVIVENVFAWPGIGTTVVEAIIAKDYPLVQAVVLVLGAIVLVVNLLIDVVLGLLDPRSLIRES